MGAAGNRVADIVCVAEGAVNRSGQSAYDLPIEPEGEFPALHTGVPRGVSVEEAPGEVPCPSTGYDSGIHLQGHPGVVSDRQHSLSRGEAVIALFRGHDDHSVVAHFEEVGDYPCIAPLPVLVGAGYAHQHPIDEDLQGVVGQPAPRQVVLDRPLQGEQVSDSDSWGPDHRYLDWAVDSEDGRGVGTQYEFLALEGYQHHTRAKLHIRRDRDVEAEGPILINCQTGQELPVHRDLEVPVG